MERIGSAWGPPAHPQCYKARLSQNKRCWLWLNQFAPEEAKSNITTFYSAFNRTDSASVVMLGKLESKRVRINKIGTDCAKLDQNRPSGARLVSINVILSGIGEAWLGQVRSSLASADQISQAGNCFNCIKLDWGGLNSSRNDGVKLGQTES